MRKGSRATPIRRQGVNGKFRANQGAKFTVNACALFSGSNFRIVVSLYVGLSGNAQNLLRAEADAHFAFLAAFRDDKYFPAWHCYSIQVQRGAGIHLHGLIPRVRISSNRRL